MTTDDLIQSVQEWSRARSLHEGDSARQMLKTVEEVGEVAQALAKGNQGSLCDGIGDVVVTLIILAQQNDMTINECLSQAWGEIKDRTGKTVDGVFIKSEDLTE